MMKNFTGIAVAAAFVLATGCSGTDVPEEQPLQTQKPAAAAEATPAAMPMASNATAPGGISVSGSFSDGTFTGEGNGYLGTMTLEVTIEGGNISSISVLSADDTESIFDPAFETVTAAIISANTIMGVDTVSGATYSAKGIVEATASALEKAGATVVWPEAAEVTPRELPTATGGDIYRGLAGTTIGRAGPRADAEGVMMYSFNVSIASALFDSDGKILDVQVDIYEVATPNYTGGTPRFSGWPGTEGYNTYDRESETLVGLSDNTEELFMSEVDSWITKRERGTDYGMNAQNEWYQQMDWFEDWMVGQTVAEVRHWFDNYTTAAGRPINPESDNEADMAALAEMSPEEIEMLTDIIAGATMSISDSHGLMLEAIEKAYENRELIIKGE